MMLPDKKGHFGIYGGKFAPETLMPALAELEAAYLAAKKDREFQAELDYYFRKFGSSSTIDIKAGNAWQVDDVRAQLAQRNPKYIWFIGQYLFYEKDFQDFLDHDYQRVGQQKFYRIAVTLYENPGGK